MCPLGWSEAEGEGMEVCAEAEMDVGVTVEKLNAGVAIGCVGWEEFTPKGVEA